MVLKVSTEQCIVNTLEYSKKKGTRTFSKKYTRTKNCEFSYNNFANFL